MYSQPILRKSLHIECCARSDAWQFIHDHSSILNSKGLLKLLLPASSGYVAQSGFLVRRMVDCSYVAKVQEFLRPGKPIKGHTVEDYRSMSLSDLLPVCYAAMVVENEDKSAAVDDELCKRISFPWLSQSRIARKRLALVGVSSISKAEGYAVAARSLNAALVAFDAPMHWMASDAHAHLREEFVRLDLTADDNTPQRIAAALLEYQKDGKRLDGLMTCEKHLLTIVAQAATLSRLSTSPPEAVAIAQNKFKTRQLDTNVYCRLVRSPADLERLLSEDGARLPYPLIVKSAKRWSSEGAWEVENEQQLREKVPTLWRDAFTTWHGRDVVIETYIEGPEVDANMVLVDSKVAFFEVNDDIPSSGDCSAGIEQVEDRVVNFVEPSNMLSSPLPASEIAALQQRLHKLVLSAGFLDGVLRLEAKLRNSSCHYAKDADLDGLVDLQRKKDTNTTTKPEDVFLIEINPRAPGWQEVEATAHAYSVSYYTLCVLRAIADRDRTLALSRPFVGGAQYHMQLLFVAAQRGGVYTYGDVCDAVL